MKVCVRSVVPEESLPRSRDTHTDREAVTYYLAHPLRSFLN
jgi:hypothetical protein